MNTKPLVPIDPYRILFPLGILHALLGTLYWVLHAVQLLPYPGVQHSHQMFTGFLLSFASGFLLTSIPRFTGTRTCSLLELSLGVALSLSSFAFHQSLTAFLTFVFLAFFILRRFGREGGFAPPPHFIFLPIGLTMGLSSSLYLSLAQYGFVSGAHVVDARLVLYSGTMLAFILGIGAKLISALLGWSETPVHRIESDIRNAAKPRLTPNDLIPWIQAALFVLSFAVEFADSTGVGKALRAVVATWIARQKWRLHHLPRSRGKLPFWLWIASWGLIAGLWTQAFVPSLGVHAAHLVFVIGYGLITLMVASRVTLAHGGHSLDFETKANIYPFIGVLLILAGATRFSAIWTENYLLHLAYAAITWMIAIAAWAFYFVPKIVKRDH